jgi:hypothetical protein
VLESKTVCGEDGGSTEHCQVGPLRRLSDFLVSRNFDSWHTHSSGSRSDLPLMRMVVQ